MDSKPASPEGPEVYKQSQENLLLSLSERAISICHGRGLLSKNNKIMDILCCIEYFVWMNGYLVLSGAICIPQNLHDVAQRDVREMPATMSV